MAGVAGPMWHRQERPGAVRFMLGLLVGGLIGSLLLALPVYLLGRAAEAVLPEPVRWAALVLVVVVFGVLDVTLRTPHAQRQVPQGLVRTMNPGALGVVWGIDLAVMFTTQKTTSLLWVTLAGLILVAPASTPVVLVVVWLAAWVAMVYLTVRRPRTVPIGEERGRTWQDWLRILRRVSGMMLLSAGAAGVWLTTWASTGS